MKSQVSEDVESIETEYCFNIMLSTSLTEEENIKMAWLLSETYEVCIVIYLCTLLHECI